MNFLKLRNFFIYIINFYEVAISPLKPACCRFYPSCSSYARDSYFYHGVFRGTYLSFLRILKCHPFHPGGYDPVPTNKTRINSDG